ncbi:hypothetical protein HPP92_015103 [Vanilla planifolia]|uniref:Uncharacterized protein n=1 Tax=Vanilla planifolia TaxID=51239 RepID=A0A835UVH3_VANPL|nr:hypothetical protein HPP92_015103 [Vanilla planifolia]
MEGKPKRTSNPFKYVENASYEGAFGFRFTCCAALRICRPPLFCRPSPPPPVKCSLDILKLAQSTLVAMHGIKTSRSTTKAIVRFGYGSGTNPPNRAEARWR